MHNIETTVVALTVSDDTYTAHIATTGNHSDSARVESDKVGNLTGLDIDLYGVVNLDCWIGVADGTGVVGDEVWDALGAELDTLDFCKLVGRFGV